jgi:hypothetical protein
MSGSQPLPVCWLFNENSLPGIVWIVCIPFDLYNMTLSVEHTSSVVRGYAAHVVIFPLPPGLPTALTEKTQVE